MTLSQCRELMRLTKTESQTTLMAALQLEHAGLISDLCVWPEDVADADAEKAIATLTAEQKDL